MFKSSHAFCICICVLTPGQTQGRGGETSEGARFEASEGHRLRHLLNSHRFHFHPHAAVPLEMLATIFLSI